MNSTPWTRRAVDFFSSVWMGIFWATLLFIYCTIGSAMPAIRQHPALEMTEFQWFHWWPFHVLIIALCVNLIMATVLRIPPRLVNAGVWTIHAGIIVLCLGSYYYFGTKVEGDAPVFRRQVRVELPGLSEAKSMPVLPGNETVAASGGKLWRFRVQGTNAQWPILSEEHQGKSAYAVNIMVTPPEGEPFIRQLLAGYPQYTEDVIPGQGRAVKSIGRKLIDEDLSITLDYQPQEYFHVMDTWALYVRPTGEKEWRQRPIESLPRYNDRISSREQVFTDPHYQLEIRPLDMLVPPPPGGDALSAAAVRITGYLRYAQLQPRWRDGGDRLNPVIRISVLHGDGQDQSLDLAAFDRVRRTSNTGMIEFIWLDDRSQVETLPADAQAVLHVEIPDADVSFDRRIDAESVARSGAKFEPIEGTAFAYRILNVQDNLVLPGGNRTVSVAMVEIKTPDGTFTRMVADRPEMTRDMHGDSPDPHTPHARKPEAADARIVTTYQPQSAPIIVAAHPQGLFLVVNGPDGRLLAEDMSVGEAVEVVPGLNVRADALYTHAVAEVKPYVVPPSSRQRDAGETFAMIRLEVDTGHELQSEWVRFNQYAMPDEQFAYAGRFAFSPEHFRLPGGRSVEVLFSRERRKLPNPVALDNFTLDTHAGGYTGQALTIRNYISELRFLSDGEWTEPTPIKVNAPTEFGGFWYFQSMWDKPPNDDPSGGMNYTGLGVGNRNGVYIQLAGCCLAVAGMIFAFYVKPILLRRRFVSGRALIDLGTSVVEEEEAEVAAAVGVS